MAYRRRSKQPVDIVVQLPLFFNSTEVIKDTHEIKNWLEEVICLMENAVETTDIKEILLPLLFYKYLSDITDLYLADPRVFKLPTDYCWDTIFNSQSDEPFGRFVTRIMHDLVQLSPELEGVLNLKSYDRYDDDILKRLVAVINRPRLNLTDDRDLWSNIYEYLLQRFPQRKQGVEQSFYTPRDVVTLMIGLSNPDSKNSFYDPACGSGCLSGLFHYFNPDLTEKKRDMKLVGQDGPSIDSALVKIDLLFCDEARISTSDALNEPLFEENGELKGFDYVLANPPWNLHGHEKEFYETDSWNRFHYGSPPKKTADWGWIQHILACLEKKKGKATVILDLGALSRGSGSASPNSERDIRKGIIEQDIIEVVITLPGNLFYGTSAPCCLLLFNTNKKPEHKEHILFIDALNSFKKPKSSRRVGLKQEDYDGIIKTYERWKAVEDYSCVAAFSQVRSHDYDLRPILYTSKEINIHYRSEDIIEQELIKVGRERISNDFKILEYFHYPIHEAVHLEIFFKTSLLGLNSKNFDHALRMLLENSIKSREQELFLEMERREVISHILFALDVEKVPLERHTKISVGFTPNKKERTELFQGGEYVTWVKAGDLEPEYVLNAEGRIPKILTRNTPSSPRAIRPVNTVLLAICGGVSTVGKTAILGVPAAINQAVCCFLPQENFLDRSYLFCYLTYMRRRWGRDVTGSRQDLSLLSVKNHSIPLPDIKYQQKIAAKLQPYNERVCGLKQEIHLLRQILRA